MPPVRKVSVWQPARRPSGIDSADDADRPVDAQDLGLEDRDDDDEQPEERQQRDERLVTEQGPEAGADAGARRGSETPAAPLIRGSFEAARSCRS